jgi:hypothetical protein
LKAFGEKVVQNFTKSELFKTRNVQSRWSRIPEKALRNFL